MVDSADEEASDTEGLIYTLYMKKLKHREAKKQLTEAGTSFEPKKCNCSQALTTMV